MTIRPDVPAAFVPRASRTQRAKRSLARLMARRPVDRQPLRTTIAILKAQQEATFDGILVVDQSGNVLSYNRRFLEIWGIPPDIAARADDNELLGYAAGAVADWDDFIELVNYLYEHPDEVRHGDPVPLKDGRTLHRSSTPIIVGGNTVGRAWYFRDMTEAYKAEKLQAALFRIAQLSRESESLDAFYAAVHAIVGDLMNATNFYIAQYDIERNILTFPYFVDEYDKFVDGLNPGRGLSAYVLRTGKPLLATPEVFDGLVAAGEVESVGAPSLDWLGAPLKTGDLTWGVIGTQSYTETTRYSEKDKEILVFVAQHVATAIEQKRKEDAIRASERRYRQMFETNRAVQILLDPGTGVIVDANLAACDFYGYSREELRSMHIWDINILGEEQIREEMTKAREEQRSYFVFRHMLASGEIRDVEVHSGPIDTGGRRLLYSIIHDITERKRAEEALVRSEEKYRNIFNFASVGIYQSTFEGKLLTANVTLARMLGYESVSELLEINLGNDVYYFPG
ncbi:MAG TPA: PAS domain S-box protein, partial [Thermoanaerobaculia bacterium]|nr:PAS domain S-box protein [Thermoanaerobaculia bacterium]